MDGVLDGLWSEWFDGLQLKHQGGQTLLSGVLADQPALHGILDKVRDLGLSIIAVPRLPPPEEARIAGTMSSTGRYEMATTGTPSVVGFDDLPHTEHAHEFAGAEHGDVPFSIILVHAAPGAGPRLHRHPYPEVFVVESGEARFQLGDDTMVVGSGRIVVGPANVPHGFTNTGSEPLRLTAIHGAAAFETEWLTGPDTVWASNPKG